MSHKCDTQWLIDSMIDWVSVAAMEWSNAFVYKVNGAPESIHLTTQLMISDFTL